jgi:hypothetical protein
MSCGQSNKKSVNNNSIPHGATASPLIDSSLKAGSPGTLAIVKVTTDKVSMTNEKNGITDWRDFWQTIKTGIVAKDTATIVGSTNFPFFINSSLSQVDDFKENYIWQLFEMNLNKAGEPKFEGNHTFGGRDDQTNISTHLTCDSTFYIYLPHQIVYFGKVKGYYKLLGTETPG